MGSLTSVAHLEAFVINLCDFGYIIQQDS